MTQKIKLFAVARNFLFILRRKSEDSQLVSSLYRGNELLFAWLMSFLARKAFFAHERKHGIDVLWEEITASKTLVSRWRNCPKAQTLPDFTVDLKIHYHQMSVELLKVGFTGKKLYCTGNTHKFEILELWGRHYSLKNFPDFAIGFKGSVIKYRSVELFKVNFTRNCFEMRTILNCIEQ